jgi:signal transduction histidine kinase
MTRPSTQENASGIPNDIKTKICCLRTTFLMSMIASAVICGSITFTTVQNFEQDLTEQSYYSVAASALKTAQGIALRKIKGAKVMASMVSYRFPDASMWPNVAQPGFTETGLLLTETAQTTFALCVVVRPEEVEDFETFAAGVYQEQNYPNDTGIGDFGFGIWSTSDDPSFEGKIHSTSGNTSWGGRNSILLPLFQHTNRTAKVLMSNLYASESTGRQIDDAFDCSNNANASSTSAINCGILTGFISLRSRPGPGAVFYEPVHPVNDRTTVVGFTTTSFTWEEILNDSVPDYIQGFYCVVSAENESYTFLMVEGVAKLLGKGDLHDTAYDKYASTATIGEEFSQASLSVTYNLTFYPSKQLFESNTSNPRAWAIAMGFVAVIIVSTSLFFLYDILMRNEARQQKVILEVKRRFVRFVSHEIRTPLNTVCLGLELLQSDLSAANKKAEVTDNESEKVQEHEPTLDFNVVALSLPMVEDILENANNAVGILNDLLNYDKMEHGTLTLELGPVAIWDVISRTVSSFDIQAKKRSMELTCQIESPQVDSARLKVWGDDVRLRQIIRNVVSNSLKFCPEVTGKIVVELVHNPSGLPNAVLPRSDIVGAATSNVLACNYPRAGSIRVSVTDNGVGMTASQLQRLFQEGVQFEPNKLQVC